MGTPDFAVPTLQVLLDEGHEVCAVVTQPDRQKGRGKKLASPPVKVVAEKNNIPVYQPVKVKTQEFVKILEDICPDIIIVVAFGQILSKEILDIPKYGCVNVHASLLPKYRGAAPINWCIINGEKTTGITTMYMDVGLDTGDMILKDEIEIYPTETAGELHDRLCILGAETLKKTMKLIENGKAPRIPQNNHQSTYAPIMKKSLGKIDWSKSSEEIRNLIRGTYPWPSAYSSYDGKTFKILSCKVQDTKVENKKYGYIQDVLKDSIVVACGKGFIRIFNIQFQNEKKMCVEDYLRGHNIDIDTKLV